MNAITRLRVLGLATLVLALAPLSFGQPGRIRVDVLARLASDGAHAGSRVYAALEVELEQGYHVNSNQPLDDFLIPTVLTLDLPDGIGVRAIAYPDAILFDQTGQDTPLAVFEEKFVIGVALDLSEALPLGDHVVPATLRYQACDETLCYLPTSVDTEFPLTVVPRDQELTARHTELFAGISFERAAPGVAGEETIRPTTEAEGSAAAGDVLGLLDEFSILGTTGGYLGSGDFLSFIHAAESGEVQKGLFEGQGPLAILALILLGGLALNLTPCVLPMIPINLAIIGAGSRAGSRLRGFFLGGAYGAAMAAVYGGLGLVVVLTASTFGTINASPWFNLSIAVLFVVLTLAMFDVIVIDFSRLQSKFHFGEGGKGSFLVAFGMGAVAALLAGACVAPVVIQVILFSSNLYATGTAIALALPFVLGVGMALPWPIAGASLSALPKPGPWMVHVKHALGVFILATATYYGYLSYTLFADRWVDAADVTSSVEELVNEGWYASMHQGLQDARDQNTLVLVDVWATWCKNCLTMDKTTLKNPDVQAGLADYVKIKFQAEDPSTSPAKEVMEQFGAIGLPAYAILRPMPAAQTAAAPVRR